MASRIGRKIGILQIVIMIVLAVVGYSKQSVEAAEPSQTDIPKEIVLENGFKITYDRVEYHADDTSTWFYTVEELPGAKDLGNWVLETPFCAPILDASPKRWEIVDPDPNARLSGIKWEVGSKFVRGQFWVRLDATVEVGITNVAAKGPDVAFGEIAGPSCITEEPPPPPPGDDQPPTITWIAPVAEDGRYDMQEGETVNLIVAATDNIAVDRVEFLRWDAINEIFVPVGVDRAAPYEVVVSASELNPTWNHMIAASFDSEGNQSEWSGIWLYKTQTGPLFRINDYLIFLPVMR